MNIQKSKGLIFIIIFYLFIGLFQSATAQDCYNYFEGKKRFYNFSTERVAIKFKKHTSDVSKNQLLNTSLLEKRESANDDMEIIRLKKGSDKAQIKNLLNDYQKHQDVVIASPILLNEQGREVGALTEQFIAKLKPSTTIKQLQKLASETSTEIIRQYDVQTYILSVDKKSQRDALEMANLFYESGLFEWSEPDFFLFIQFSAVPNDPLFNQQWSLNNTGQNGGVVGADIKAAQAWDITTGSPNIKVAIVDTGVETGHEDLQANMISGFDGTGNGSGGNPTIGSGSSGHGTAVAGIVGAVGNNNLGIAGVAYNCKIFSSRMSVGGGLITGSNASQVAEAIRLAYQDGQADILNFSWGSIGEFASISSQIDNAVSLGRGGKGCVVIASAGNQNVFTHETFAIDFPARKANVMAVGASTPSDVKVNNSCFGAEIDVVAPGQSIYTTDLTGSNGYGTGNYTNNVGGTSMAAPHVAGIAALILSINPNLTQSEVRTIIEQSAEKVGGYNYSTTSGYPNGTWNTEMGYGRVNAYNALIKTRNCFTLPSSSLLSANGAGMTVTSSGLALAPVYNGSLITSTPNSQGILEAEWASNSSSVYVSQSGITATAFPSAGCVGGVASLRVRVRNCAGWSGWSFFNVNVCGSGFRFAYSPNPTSDKLDITAEPTEENKDFKIATSIDFEVKLIDADGKTVREGKNLSKEKKITLDVNGLKEGVYFLHIAYGKEVEKHQIVVGKAAN